MYSASQGEHSGRKRERETERQYGGREKSHQMKLLTANTEK